MSAVPDPMRCRILREGYLDVKPPPDSPERILHKAWRRLWVIAAVFLPKGRGEPHLIMEFSRRTDDEPLKRVKASRDGLRLFRCNSGSRPLRTWALSSGSSLLVYLAARTEGETQDWMETIRDGLWPPIYNNHSRSGKCHDVSLIDDEKSFSSGLLGVYGCLLKTSDDAMSIIHPHWQGTQMRWLLTDIVAVRLVRKIGPEEEDAGVLSLSVKSSKKETRILHFYSKTASATVAWIQSILENSKSPSMHKSNKGKNNTESVSTNRTLDPTPAYAVVQKSKTTQSLQTEEKSHGKDSESDILPEKAKLEATYYHLGNIPSNFLDASMNSALPQVDGNSSPTEIKTKSMRLSASGDDSEDDEDALTELYDHIYEDLNPRQSRSDTVYEEVDDDDYGEAEYIPPMPPTPPARPNSVPVLRPNSLQLQNSAPGPVAMRLLKLSESVTEALKMVEENSPKPIKPIETRPSLHRKGHKKSKSLQHSPTVEMKSSPAVSECKCSVHRAHSESNIKDTALYSNELPLRPFNVSPACTNLKKQEWKDQLAKQVKAQPPLVDLLKSLHVNSDLPTNPTDEPKRQLNWKCKEIPQLHITSTETPAATSSGGTDAEYIDMR